MTIPDRELEFSPLSGLVTRNGITVEGRIYRFAEPDEHWKLEVIDQDGSSTVWDEVFPTDQEAYRVFHRTLDAEGIHSFLDDSPSDGAPHLAAEQLKPLG